MLDTIRNAEYVKGYGAGFQEGIEEAFRLIVTADNSHESRLVPTAPASENGFADEVERILRTNGEGQTAKELADALGLPSARGLAMRLGKLDNIEREGDRYVIA